MSSNDWEEIDSCCEAHAIEHAMALLADDLDDVVTEMRTQMGPGLRAEGLSEAEIDQRLLACEAWMRTTVRRQAERTIAAARTIVH